MEEAFYILGVKIHIDHSHKLVAFSQEHYIKNILEWFNRQDCNPIDTPFARGENLSKEIGPKTLKENRKRTNVPYSSAIGSLMYATMCTRLYIPAMLLGWWVVTKKNPRMMHWKIVKRILQYLKGIVDYSFCYQGKKLCLVGYSHVFWEGDLDERKSTSRYTFLLNNGANQSWKLSLLFVQL